MSAARERVTADVWRAYSAIADLPVVESSTVGQVDETATISLQLSPGVDRVPPAVLRVAAANDFGIADVRDGAAGSLVVELVARVGVGVGGGP